MITRDLPLLQYYQHEITWKERAVEFCKYWRYYRFALSVGV